MIEKNNTTISIERELKRGELVKLIRDMKPGDAYKFPLSKLETVRNIAYNRLLEEKAEGAQWKVTTDLPTKSITIIRLS